MPRKLFCEISPFTYMLSVARLTVQRNLKKRTVTSLQIHKKGTDEDR